MAVQARSSVLPTVLCPHTPIGQCAPRGPPATMQNQQSDELDFLNVRLQKLLRQGQLALDVSGPLTPSQNMAILAPFSSQFANDSKKTARRGSVDTNPVASQRIPMTRERSESVNSVPRRTLFTLGSPKFSPPKTRPEAISSVPIEGIVPQETHENHQLPTDAAIENEQSMEIGLPSSPEDEIDWDQMDNLTDEMIRLQGENIQLRLELQGLRQHYEGTVNTTMRESNALRALVFQLSDMLRREMHSQKAREVIASRDGEDERAARELELERGATLTDESEGGPQVKIVKLCMLKEHDQAITRVRFANSARTLAAFSSQDGRITVIQITSEASILHTMDGHDSGVADFDWSFDNEKIASVGGEDKTCKVWDTKTGHLLRSMSVGSNVTCCVFFPSNGDLLIVGTTSGSILSFNITTGQNVGKEKVGTEVTALVFDGTGHLLFVGDALGHVTTYEFNPEGSGGISFWGSSMLTRKYRASLGNPVTGLYYQRQKRIELPDSLLLVTIKPSVLCLFSVNRGGELAVERQYSINIKSDAVDLGCRAVMGPDSTIVAGNMHNTVMVINAESGAEKKSKKAELYGHGTPVLSLAFNVDNSVLLSGDESGAVLAWRRVVVHRKDEMVFSDDD